LGVEDAVTAVARLGQVEQPEWVLGWIGSCQVVKTDGHELSRDLFHHREGPVEVAGNRSCGAGAGGDHQDCLVVGADQESGIQLPETF
jgi:hypothetical protein